MRFPCSTSHWALVLVGLIGTQGASAFDLSQATKSQNIEDRRNDPSSGFALLAGNLRRAGDHLVSLRDQFQKAAPPGLGGKCPVISAKEFEWYSKAIQGYQAWLKTRELEKLPGLDSSNDFGLLEDNSVDACSGAYEAELNVLRSKSELVDKHFQAIADPLISDSRDKADWLAISLGNDKGPLPPVSWLCDTTRKKLRGILKKHVQPFVDSYDSLREELSRAYGALSSSVAAMKKRQQTLSCGSVGSASNSRSVRTSTITSVPLPPRRPADLGGHIPLPPARPKGL